MVDDQSRRLSRDQRLAKQQELFAKVEREQDKIRAKIRENTARLRQLRQAKEAEEEKHAAEQRLAKKPRKRTPPSS